MGTNTCMKLLVLHAVFAVLAFAQHEDLKSREKACPRQPRYYKKSALTLKNPKGWYRVWKNQCANENGACLQMWNGVLKQISEDSISAKQFFSGQRKKGNGKYCQWKNWKNDEIAGYCLTACPSEQPYVITNGRGDYIFKGPVDEIENGKKSPKMLLVFRNSNGYKIKKSPGKKYWKQHNCRVPAKHVHDKKAGICKLFPGFC